MRLNVVLCLVNSIFVLILWSVDFVKVWQKVQSCYNDIRKTRIEHSNNQTFTLSKPIHWQCVKWISNECFPRYFLFQNNISVECQALEEENCQQNHYRYHERASLRSHPEGEVLPRGLRDHRLHGPAEPRSVIVKLTDPGHYRAPAGHSLPASQQLLCSCRPELRLNVPVSIYSSSSS